MSRAIRGIVATVTTWLVPTLVPLMAQAQVHTLDVSAEEVEVQQALSTPAMQQAMRFMEQEQAQPNDILQEWLGICNAYGPESDEIYRSRHLYKLFRIYGLQDVHIDEEWNVIGVRPGIGHGPKLVLNAHEDVVNLWPKDQPIEAFVADGRVWCPGASDDIIGVVQMLEVLRALNQADVRTVGDIWFVAFTGEERESRGARRFVAENYPINLDWRRGDILVQFHGPGGEGITSGSDPIYNESILHLFTPFERNDPALPSGVDRRWLPHTVDALARIVVHIRDEVWDARTGQVGFRDLGQTTRPAVLYLNMAKITGIPIMNAPASEASITFDLRSKDPARIDQAHKDIMRIAGEVCDSFPKTIPCNYQYEVVSRSGLPGGIPGFDKTNNRAARVAVAAANVLYGAAGVRGTVDPEQGCGDCIASYMEGMPAMSLRGAILDHGGGRVEIGGGGQAGALQSAHGRRRTTGHDVTQSADIASIWSAAKQALAFAVAYVGLVR
jgi:acetylornithine deacetylase/succinyl-diaminopimelate desuccinylase-like protein